MVLERSIYSDFVFLEAMYNQGFIRKECELCHTPSADGDTSAEAEGRVFCAVPYRIPQGKGSSTSSHCPCIPK